MTYLTFKEYAERKNVSAPIITRAVQAGRIKESVIENDNGMRLIDSEIADKEWEQNTDKSKLVGGLAVQKKFKGKSKKDIELEETEESDDDTPPFHVSRAKKEAYQAKITQLTYEEMAGKLYRDDIVDEVWTNMVAAFRSRMLAVPSRAAQTVTGKTDHHEVEKMIRDLTYEALEELSAYDPDQYKEKS